MSHIDVRPPGVHKMPLAQVEEMFVDAAPFEGERQEIWDSFSTYVTLLGYLVPNTRLIIDGSFTTWNTDHPPHDIDFVAMLDLMVWSALPDDQRDRLKHIRETDDKLDAHFIPDWDEYLEAIIVAQFEVVRDHEGRRIPGERKGVIEVTL